MKHLLTVWFINGALNQQNSLDSFSKNVEGIAQMPLPGNNLGDLIQTAVFKRLYAFQNGFIKMDELD
jgi:hypothetical protein